MADIRPFQGLRYNTKVAGPLEQLVCPPYDIISEEQRQNYLRENEYNVIRLELPKGEQPYEQAAQTLRDWLDNGVLGCDSRNAIYVYEEQFTVKGEKKAIKGIICRVRAEEFSKGVILPHEETLSKAKDDRFNLMKATYCNFSQIYSLYHDHKRVTDRLIDAQSNRPADAECTDENGIVHRLWRITDEEVVAQLRGQFADRKLYIADGHHRYETALNFKKYLEEKGICIGKGHPANFVMMMLVNIDHEGLVVFPTHRMLRDLEDFDHQKVLEKCSAEFSIEPVEGLEGLDAAHKAEKIEELLAGYYTKGQKAYVLYSGAAGCNLLCLKDSNVMAQLLPEMSEAYRNLDVSILHTLILEKHLGIDKENMAKQLNLTYTRDILEAIEAVDSGDYQCSFILNPTRVTEISDVAAAGEKMPQKSTYFYPKLITGMVMNQILDLRDLDENKKGR